jgi:cytoskeleton protein RodZ
MPMTLEAIGQKLKSAREAQGLSLRQIYERTKIPINHLQSIDSGQKEDLPETVYVAGFIKRYAECIGLDGQLLADEYRQQAAEEQHAHTGNGNGRTNGRKEVAQPLYVTPDYLKHAKVDNRPPTYKMWVFNTLGIVLVVATLAWYFQSNSASNQQDPSLASLKETAKTAAPTQTNTGTGTSITAAPSANPNRLKLNATQHVWVEVKELSSGASAYTGYLEQGESREFSDVQGLRVRAGNGGNLSVEFKGTIEPFGKSGKVAERTFLASAASGTPAAPPSDTPADGSAATGATTASTTTPVKPKKTAKRPDPKVTDGYRRVDDLPSRQYVPGESLGDGGTKSIDVPYRYSEGRLDAN